MEVGDKLEFKKFYWEISSKKRNPRCPSEYEYKYRVIRKYFNGLLKLKYSKCTYPITKSRWEFLKKKLKENPDYHYTMSLWSNQNRF
jgi:hypothetical protein